MLRAAIGRGAATAAEHVALNDVVITRGALSRIIELSVSVGGEFVARFNGDGLIVASPTGSTAYNLSAGGPILHPDVDALVLTPIAPHTLTNRPVVIPARNEVAVQPQVTDASQEVFLTLDGQSGARLEPGDVVRITEEREARAAHPDRDAKLLRGAAPEAEMGGTIATMPYAVACYRGVLCSRKYLTWYFATLRLCSASVLAKTCVPSLRLTKYR